MVVPLGVPHVAAADTTIRGYTIPKGAVIVSNISEVLNSEELWKDSGAFKPERFLTADGELIKRDELIFFSSGKTSLLAVIRHVMNIKKHIIYPFGQKTNITCFIKLLIM